MDISTYSIGKYILYTVNKLLLTSAFNDKASLFYRPAARIALEV